MNVQVEALLDRMGGGRLSKCVTLELIVYQEAEEKSLFTRVQKTDNQNVRDANILRVAIIVIKSNSLY